ncbi:universal stress protein [Haloplanus salilacus]|uniref:universal stress protein n=1 Tax=Haloplanus salilacus TaxID=2949994 RepID=UPI0030CFEA9F
MYETILLPVDGSAGAAAATEHAVDLAKAHGATLHVLYVVDVRMSPIGTDASHADVMELVEASTERPTADALDRAETAGVEAVEVIRHGVPSQRIGEYADAEDVDLIVMGTHGRTGVAHVVLGSVADRVVRTADTPVLTVPPRDA